MSNLGHPHWSGQTAVIGTMHGKEAVIAPILGATGLRFEIAKEFDTDQFGTFTRDIARQGDQFATVRAKAKAALAWSHASIAIASEGSFGPHLSVPWLPANLEVVLLLDARTGREYIGKTLTTRCTQAHTVIRSLHDAEKFANANGFPEHALVIRTGAGDDAAVLAKGIQDPGRLEALVNQGLSRWPELMLEVDLRAHLNPTRMETIATATRDLLRIITTDCPHCQMPGFDVVERMAGLPCEACGAPTHLTRLEILACPVCQHRLERLPDNAPSAADPGHCDRCNP